MGTCPVKKDLQFDFDWLASGQTDASERAGLAALSICVNGKPVTELEDIFAKTVRRGARVSAHDLALWLAANWWRLRWEPQRESLSWKMSHQIGAVGGGYAWPDISFSSDGDFILIVGRPSSDWVGAPVRYLHAFEEIIGASEFEQGIDRYIEAVLERMSSFEHIESTLPDLWAEICEERKAPEQVDWRKLEALLGYDPDEASPSVIEVLQGMGKTVGRCAIEEIASASQNNALDHIRTLLAHQGEAVPTIVPGRASLREKINQVAYMALPWQQAERAAGLVRDEWDINSDEPIRNKDLSDLLGISLAHLSDSDSAGNYPLAAGFRNAAADSGLKVMLTKRSLTGKRFELARLVGDDLAAPATEQLLPATNAKTSRQKFQRAFAQELLCPFAALDVFIGGEIPDDDKMEEAAAHFQVSPLLVKTTLVNRGRLSRFELARG